MNLELRELLREVDWIEIFESEPDLGLGILDTDGNILYFNAASQQLFEIPDGLEHNLRAIFNDEFAEERLRWIRQCIVSRKPIRVRYIYRGKPISTGFYPLTKQNVLHVSRLDPAGVSSSNVESEFIDLGRLSPLNGRELRIMALLGQGNSVPEVAQLLGRSARTVERHKAEIGRKLGISTLSEIARLVTQIGLRYDDSKLKRLQALRVQSADSNHD